MIQNILAFVLGVSAVALVWGVVVAFKTASKVKTIEQTIHNIENWVSRTDEMVNRRIDQEIDRTDNLFNKSISHTDSRVDKLQASIPPAGKKSKKLLKG